LIEGVDVPSHIQLGHTSGLAQRMLTIQKLDPVPDGHWAAKSDGGRSVGVGVLSRW